MKRKLMKGGNSVVAQNAVRILRIETPPVGETLELTAGHETTPRHQYPDGSWDVMEILRIHYWSGVVEVLDGLAGHMQWLASGYTVAFPATELPIVTNSFAVLAMARNQNAFGFQSSSGARAPNVAPKNFPEVVDMTDGAGHGYLYTGANLFMVYYSIWDPLLSQGTADVYYRMKRISAFDFIRLYQSQGHPGDAQDYPL